MSIIKDTLLEPYFILCENGQYTVKEDTGKLDKNLKPVSKSISWHSNKYSALRRIVKAKVENIDCSRTIKQHQELEMGLLRELINALGE